MKTKEELIQVLGEKIKDCKDGYDDVSWGMQEGILISKKQAMKILAELNKPALPTRKQLIRTINKVVDEHQCLGAEHIAHGIIEITNPQNKRRLRQHTASRNITK